MEEHRAWDLDLDSAGANAALDSDFARSGKAAVQAYQVPVSKASAGGVDLTE